MSEPFNFKGLNFDTNVLNTISNYNQIMPSIGEFNKVMEENSNLVASAIKEKEDREKRLLEINEKRLQYDELKLFLLSSVNKEQRSMLEKIDSLIDTIKFSNKVTEGNLSLIEEELSKLKESTGNLNEGFIQLIQKKMIEDGVEVAMATFFLWLKRIFLT